MIIIKASCAENYQNWKATPPRHQALPCLSVARKMASSSFQSRKVHIVK